MSTKSKSAVISVEEGCFLQYELIVGILREEGERVTTYGILLLERDNLGNVVNIKRFDNFSSVKETAVEFIRRLKMHHITPEKVDEFVEEFIEFPDIF